MNFQILRDRLPKVKGRKKRRLEKKLAKFGQLEAPAPAAPVNAEPKKKAKKTAKKKS